MANRSKSFKARAGRLLFLFAAAVPMVNCAHEPDEPTGGETHFLTACEPSSNSCGSELVCLCGVCTQPCGEQAVCQAFPAAACAQPSAGQSCSDFQAQGHCDVQCLGDADCTVLSPSYHCDQGACRARAGGANTCAMGTVAANQVLIIGDSFFASTHAIVADLDELARSAGALAADAGYPDNSNLTANALALAGTGIADQYTAGSADAEAVIMNGGGADVILGSCDTVDAQCPVLVAAVAAAQDLFTKMAAGGVQEVVYAFYPDPVDPAVQAKMDVLRPLLQGACASSPVPCHWLDLRPTFAGHYSEYVEADGLNPTAAGSQASAAAIWTTMQLYCIAQ